MHGFTLNAGPLGIRREGPLPLLRCAQPVRRSTVRSQTTMADSIPQPSLAAERMRRHRQRRRDGLRCFVIELRETEIEALVSKGLLKQETRSDANAIIQALYAFLDLALGQQA
jgi:hypothetical protein